MASGSTILLLAGLFADDSDPYNMAVNAEVFLYEEKFPPEPKTLMMFYKRLREIDVPDLAASFQQAVIDVQVAKAVRAVEETGAMTFCLGGGVAANPVLRAALTDAMEALGVHVSVPPLHLCTDNAAMIAAAAYPKFLARDFVAMDFSAEAGMALR